MLCTVWRKILTGENIDEFDKFLSICQHFSHQNFPLIICRLPARPLFAQGVIDSIRAHAKFFPVQIYIYYINGKTVVCSYARQLLAFQTDQQSCTITYILASKLPICFGIEMSQFPVTSFLFYRLLATDTRIARPHFSAGCYCYKRPC